METNTVDLRNTTLVLCELNFFTNFFFKKKSNIHHFHIPNLNIRLNMVVGTNYFKELAGHIMKLLIFALWDHISSFI